MPYLKIGDFNIKNAGINRRSVHKNTIKNTIHHRYKLRLNTMKKPIDYVMCCVLSDSKV